ncbi:hypothetical protein B0H13DRAFT_1850146 [Mycena leptocephala]|nr:hypothetical protein B0H13DRAFT_1850146 [Mycena leptocephala]
MQKICNEATSTLLLRQHWLDFHGPRCGEISPPTTPDSFCEGVGEAPHFAKPLKPSRGRAYISMLETSEADDIRDEAAIAQNLIPIPTLSGDEGTILRLETQLFEAQAKIQEFAIGETRKHGKEDELGKLKAHVEKLCNDVKLQHLDNVSLTMQLRGTKDDFERARSTGEKLLANVKELEAYREDLQTLNVNLEHELQGLRPEHVRFGTELHEREELTKVAADLEGLRATVEAQRLEIEQLRMQLEERESKSDRERNSTPETFWAVCSKPDTMEAKGCTAGQKSEIADMKTEQESGSPIDFEDRSEDLHPAELSCPEHLADTCVNDLKLAYVHVCRLKDIARRGKMNNEAMIDTPHRYKFLSLQNVQNRTRIYEESCDPIGFPSKIFDTTSNGRGKIIDCMTVYMHGIPLQMIYSENSGNEIKIIGQVLRAA